MSNRRYTGPKARETMDARREAASDVYNLLYQDPEEIVNGGKINIEEAKRALALLKKPVSINDLIRDDGDTELENFIIVSDQTPEVEIIDSSIRDSVRNLLEHSKLKTREKQVLMLRFGIEDGTIHTLEDIGSTYGITRERIRQIEAKALAKLRLFKETENLVVYMDKPDKALKRLKEFRTEYYGGKKSGNS